MINSLLKKTVGIFILKNGIPFIYRHFQQNPHSTRTGAHAHARKTTNLGENKHRIFNPIHTGITNIVRKGKSNKENENSRIYEPIKINFICFS